MVRTPNYKKWQSIYEDYKSGKTWEEIVNKHKTSKRTISKAISYYNNLENSNIDQESIYNIAKQITSTIEALNNQTRIRLVSVLIIYNELSLNKLSKKVGLSKSTVLRHLKELEKIGIIKFRKFYIWYTRGFSKIKPLRDRITKANTRKHMFDFTEELRARCV